MCCCCVSPSDPTLTVEKVVEVMGEVRDWKGVGCWHNIPNSKLAEIKQQPCTEAEKSRALGAYWVNTDPHASWEKLAWGLYRNGEEKAAEMAKQYLPKGICTLVNLHEIQLLFYILMDSYTPEFTALFVQ